MHRIVLAPQVLKTLQGVLNRRLVEQVRQSLSGLATDPEQQGWPLVGELLGYRVLRPHGGWFRIVYRVVPDVVEVVLVSVGQAQQMGARDLRALARTLFREQLLTPPTA